MLFYIIDKKAPFLFVDNQKLLMQHMQHKHTHVYILCAYIYVHVYI